MKKIFSFILMFILCTQSAFAAFSDVPQTHPNYQAINYMERTGIIQGYDDNTFRPDQNVVRAEAVKIILAPLYESFDTVGEDPFPDVSTEEWFAPFVKKAKDEGVISGDGETGNFVGSRNVNLAEFLKMLTLAYQVDLSEYQNPTEVIYDDVQDLNQWYIPYLYYAAGTNLIHADQNNNINAADPLTRSEVAEITFRLIINIQGGDVQLYLSMTEAEMIKILQYLDNNDISNAETAASRAVQYSNQAVNLSPDKPIVVAAQKIAQAFDKLVQGYRAGLNLEFESTEALAGEAWNLANEAVQVDGSVQSLSDTIKEIAHSMAEDARSGLSVE